jgi:hypothetical protein
MQKLALALVAGLNRLGREHQRQRVEDVLARLLRVRPWLSTPGTAGVDGMSQPSSPSS